MRINLVSNLPHTAGQHAQQLTNRAHTAHLTQLIRKIFEGEIARDHPLRLLTGGLLVEGSFRSLNQAQHVTHAKDTGGKSVGIKNLDRFQTFTCAEEFNRHSGDRTDRYCSPTARIAVDLGEHQTCHRDRITEANGDIDRLLADHGINYQEHLRRFYTAGDGLQFVHQLIIQLRTTSSVHDNDGKTAELAFLESMDCQLWRSYSCFREDRYAQALAKGFQLGHRGWTVRVCSHEHHPFPLRTQQASQLSSGSGLTRPLQTNQ